MNLSTAFDAAASVLRRKPADVVPFYLLGLAVPAMAQTITLAGAAVCYAYLETTGRLARLRNELSGADLPSLGADPDPDAIREWAETIAPLLELLFPPTVVAVLALTAALFVLFTFVASAAVSAGQLAACFGSVRNERGLVAGIAGVRRHWVTFLGLYVLELVLWIGLTGIAAAIVFLAASVSPVAGLLVGFVVFWAWFVGLVAFHALLAFAQVSVVVDDTGVLGAIGGSWSFIRAAPLRAFLYYGIAILSLIALGVVLVVASAGGVESAVAPLGTILLAPFFDLAKVGLFAGYRKAASPPPSADGRIVGSAANGLRRGVTEVFAFVRGAPGLHLLAVGLFAGGFGAGWALAGPYEGLIEASIAARLEGHVPPAAAAQFFGNNWSVAVSTAYAGVGVAVPAAVTLWFNGLVLGGYARLEAAPLELAAFVLPHGIVEIPAIVVAGAAGLWLGRIAWRTWRGGNGRAEFADALDRAFWIVIGLGALLFVAAVVEGFVSPYYYGAFL